MTPIDQDTELNGLGPAVIHQGVHGGPHRAPGEQDIVHQHHDLPAQREIDFAALYDRLGGYRGKVVSIEIDVQMTDRNLDSLYFPQSPGQTLRQRHPAAANANQRQSMLTPIVVEDLPAPAGEWCARSDRSS